MVGWSDGAIVGLVLALHNPDRLTRVFAFAANMDPSGVIPGFDHNPMALRFLAKAERDYRRTRSRVPPTEDRPVSTTATAPFTGRAQSEQPQRFGNYWRGVVAGLVERLAVDRVGIVARPTPRGGGHAAQRVGTGAGDVQPPLGQQRIRRHRTEQAEARSSPRTPTLPPLRA